MTSEKYIKFVSEPMGGKDVCHVAGITPELANSLKESGIAKACDLLSRFLLQKKDETLFVKWLMENSPASENEAMQCGSCLKDWCDAFM